MFPSPLRPSLPRAALLAAAIGSTIPFASATPARAAALRAGTISPVLSPRFVPLFWRVASSDAVVIGHYFVDGEQHRLVAETTLRGKFDPGRVFSFQGDEARMLETEALGFAAGTKAVFLLQETQLEDGSPAYTVSQGAGNRGSFPVKDPMGTFSTGLYELSLEDHPSVPYADFEQLLKKICADSQLLDHLLERNTKRPRGDDEVSAYDFYPALAHVRDEDVARALAKVEEDLAAKPADWVKRWAEEAKRTLTARTKAH